uniref:Uncharacterized protein n=1 Tax=Asterionellopsis glacialis TaxID=33640 RepID=A0A7S0KX08_9STRA|mmetsp:Transcript_1285/g.1793  ORF Transcript_1285/g.1793 Transcript_1285/m.1793 type:complete len:265 (+) Transcript_1285:1-795(+)
MTTIGRPGTKYLYYFSKEHSIQKSQGNEPQRSSHRLPKDSPFGESPHFNNDKFPTSGWVPPPYTNFFKMTNLKLDKPLLIISNKYTMEWDDGPINHIPIDSLFEILKFLTPRYHIVYNRFKDPRLEDKLEVQLNKNGMSEIAPYHDKEMIKRFFPSVVFFEELSENLDTDDVNLLMFALGAEAERFISVQGGNSVIASFFGGTNIIHAVKGPEVNWKSDIGGDFSYYHRFSNATIRVEQSGKSFCRAVKEDFVEDQQSVSQYCM